VEPARKREYIGKTAPLFAVVFFGSTLPPPFTLHAGTCYTKKRKTERKVLKIAEGERGSLLEPN
jgi:hypothetical protein